MPSTLFPSGGAFSIDDVHSDTWRIFMKMYDIALIPGVRASLVSIPGKVGKRNAGMEIDSRIIRMVLASVQSNYSRGITVLERSAMHDRLHAFAAAIDPRTGPHKLILLDDYPAWYINVHTASETPMAPNLIMADFTMQFEAADPHFYSNIGTIVPAATMANGASINLVNNGNQSTPVKLTITAAGTAITGTITLTLNGVAVIYNGGVGLTDTVVIDTDAFTVTKNNISDIASWNGDFPLIPSGVINALSYANSNAISATVGVTYTERNL